MFANVQRRIQRVCSKARLSMIPRAVSNYQWRNRSEKGKKTESESTMASKDELKSSRRLDFRQTFETGSTCGPKRKASSKPLRTSISALLKEQQASKPSGHIPSQKRPPPPFGQCTSQSHAVLSCNSKFLGALEAKSGPCPSW